MALTDAGREMVRHAAAVLRSLQDAEDAFAALRGLKSGRVAVGVVSTAKYFAPRFLALFAQKHPEVSVTLAVQNRDAVMQLLVDNEVDLALMGTPPAQLETTSFPFARHPLVIIAAPDHRLAGRRRVPASALAQESFLVRESGSGTRAAMERSSPSTASARRRRWRSRATRPSSRRSWPAWASASCPATPSASSSPRAASRSSRSTACRSCATGTWCTGPRKRLSPAALAFKRFVLKEGRAFLAGWPGSGKP